MFKIKQLSIKGYVTYFLYSQEMKFVEESFKVSVKICLLNQFTVDLQESLELSFSWESNLH